MKFRQTPTEQLAEDLGEFTWNALDPIWSATEAGEAAAQIQKLAEIVLDDEHPDRARLLEIIGR